MRTTATPASCPTTCAPTTPPSACLRRSSATAPTTALTAPMRSSAVRRDALVPSIKLRVTSLPFLLPLVFYRPVLPGQRRLQPQLHGGPRGGSDLLLSAGNGAGAQQQDLSDPELLRQTPQVQPTLRAGQVHRQVLLLRGLGAGARHGELQEYG